MSAVPVDSERSKYGPTTVHGGQVHLGNVYHFTTREAIWERFITSIKFPQLLSRLNDIKETQYETFEWVFEDSVDDTEHQSAIAQ